MDYTKDIFSYLQSYLPIFLIPILFMCAGFVSTITQAIKGIFKKWIFGGWSVALSFIVSFAVVFIFLSLKISFPPFSTPITLLQKFIATFIVWASANGYYRLKNK